MVLPQTVKRVPVVRSAADGSNAVVIAEVLVQTTMFGPRCFWVHIMSNLAEGRRGVPPVTMLGCAATALPLTIGSSQVSETVLLEAAAVQPELQQDGEDVTASMASPQTVFARSLASRLAKKFRSHSAADSQKGVMFTVCCGLAAAVEPVLVGSSVSGPNSSVLEFGGLMLREVASMVQEQLDVSSSLLA